MSRLSSLGAVIATLSLMATATPVAAQAQQTEEQLLARIQEILPELAEADQAANVARERRAEAARLSGQTKTDTISVGPLRIVTLPEQVELAREVYQAVWSEEYASWVDDSPSLQEHTFTFRWGGEPGIRVDPPSRNVAVASYALRGTVEDRVREAIGGALIQDLDARTPIRRWMGGSVRRDADLSDAYRAVAVSASKATRSCLTGSAAECWTALGLQPPSENRLEEWYTPEERRMLVGSQGSYLRMRRLLDDPTVVACLEAGSASACDRVILEDLNWTDFAPLSKRVRSTMTWLALERGGKGAWDRLTEAAAASPAEALQAASGLDAETLAASWREEILTARPETYATLAASRWWALFWTLVLIALAMRSTRWRLG